MKNSLSINLSSLLVIFAICQTACTAKIEGGNANPVDPGPNPLAYDIKQANGNWTTGCYQEKSGFASETTLKLADGKYEFSMKNYNTSTCEAANLVFAVDDKGEFIVEQESRTEPGSFEIRIEAQKTGYIQISYDLIHVEADKIYLGDSMAAKSGNYPTVTDRQKAFSKTP